MSRRRQHPSTERELCDAVCAALATLGWLVPTTSEAVAAAEDQLEDDAARSAGDGPLPFARVLSSQPRAPGQPRALSSGTAPVEETLARAAREGGPLSAEVEAAMRRDRAAAEAALQARQKETPDHGR